MNNTNNISDTLNSNNISDEEITDYDNLDDETTDYDKETTDYDKEASDLDEETRNIVFNASLKKNIDSFYNISSGSKHKQQQHKQLQKQQKQNNNINNKQTKNQPTNNILGLHNLKPKRHFNPRLPPWDDYKNLKNNNKKTVLDINNKNMFPEL